MSPEFTVILPSRGDSAHLRVALAAALGQQVDLEVLLTHDRRPGDRPLDPGLSADPRVRLLEAATPGLPGARNTALAAARGRFVALLDDDDLWLASHLERAAAALRRDPQAVLVATDAYLFDDPTEDGSAPLPDDLEGLPRFRPGLDAGRLALGDLLRGNPVLASAVVLARERLGREERFDTALASLEDYDLWLRLARRHPLLFEPRPAVVIRRRRGAMSRNWRRMAECGLEVLGRFAAAGIPTGVMSPPELRRRFGGLWHDLAYACLVEGDVAAARPALLQAIAHRPLLGKNYLYLAASALPPPLRRAAFRRGRRALERGLAGTPPAAHRAA